MFNEQRIEYLKAATQAGANALKISLLINGASALAMLTFIGNIANHNPPYESIIQKLAVPLCLFSSGVLCSALASGITYLAHEYYADGNDKSGRFWNGAGIFLVIISYMLFSAGCGFAYQAFLHWH